MGAAAMAFQIHDNRTLYSCPTVSTRWLRN
jgi:hypothetical protein